MASKEELLAAIAQAGTQGAQDYQAAQARLAQQQADAVRMALAGAANSTPEAQGQIASIIGQGYAPRQAQLTSNAATSSDYFNRLGAATNVYQSQVEQLGPAMLKQFEQELALKMVGGGGGGGGGGSGSGKASDPFSDLLDAYHGKENLKDAIPALARAAGVEEGDYAAQMGVPAELASAWFPSYQSRVSGAIPSYLKEKTSVRQFRTDARSAARATAGNQAEQRRQLVRQYAKQRLNKKRYRTWRKQHQQRKP